MSTYQKLLTFSGAGLLIGFGLCGVDQWFLGGDQKQFGGALAFFGFVVCLTCAVLLLATLIALLFIALNRLLTEALNKKS